MENKPEKIRLTVPNTYENKTSDEVWEELEKFIFLGFLTATSEIQGRSFVFKTLNHHEVRNINFMKPTKRSMNESRSNFRSTFIAYSLFMIDGNNALYDRQRNINKIIKIISSLNSKVQDKIIDNLTFLNERASRLYPLVEVYCYENRSRFKWLQTNQTIINDPRITGLPGTENLGMNICQQTWVSLNQIIDKREVSERDWSYSKFVGSCFAGKGIKSIDEKDKMRLEKERVEREERKIEVLFNYLNRGGSSEEKLEEVSLPDGRPAVVEKRFKAISAEELSEELSAALSGEKDAHDLIIEQHQKKASQRQKDIENTKYEYLRSPSIMPENGSSTQVIGGREAARDLIKRLEDLKIEKIENLRNHQIAAVAAFDENSENED